MELNAQSHSYSIKSQYLCYGSLIKLLQSWKMIDSPGGGPPGNGVGGIFPCWKAAAVGRKDKMLRHKQPYKHFTVRILFTLLVFVKNYLSLFCIVCVECDKTWNTRSFSNNIAWQNKYCREKLVLQCFCPLNCNILTCWEAVGLRSSCCFTDQILSCNKSLQKWTILHSCPTWALNLLCGLAACNLRGGPSKLVYIVQFKQRVCYPTHLH